MNKNIIKEIIIVLALCLIILLVLGILLYGYLPNNKIVPEKVSYVTPENIKEQINTESVNEDQIILTHEIDNAELSNYQKIKDYNPGKPNPFSSTITNTTSGTNTTSTTAGETTNSVTSAQQNTASTNNTDGTNTTNNTTTYYPDKGTK